MSAIQQTESEFAIHPFLSQQFELAQLLHFVPNLLQKIFHEIINITAKNNHRKTLLIILSV